MAKKKTAKKGAKKAPKKAPKGKAKSIVTPEESGKRQTYKKIRVNFWRTRLHAEELGVYQTLKYQAKTKIFKKNFDIEGLIEIDGEKKYVIAYNKDDWENKPDSERRLVLRLFTILEEKMGVGKGGNFKGGLELSITHSIIQSYEVKREAPVFFVNIPKVPYLIRIVKGWRLKGTRWTFPLLPEDKADKLQIVLAKGVLGVGRDYDIFIGKKKIAKLDSQRITKDVEVEIYDETYAEDKTFIILLTLFACICNFMNDTEKMIKKMYEKMKDDGTSDYKPNRYELDLFKNPRMMRK